MIINDRQLKPIKNFPVTDLPGEYWVDVPEYEGHYKISVFWRVKSVKRTILQGRGVQVRKPEQLRKQKQNSDGYLQVTLTKERVSKTLCIHILMAKAFKIPNPQNLPEVNHIDGNKLNCAPLNLEYGTHKYNMQHAVKTGLRQYEGVDCRKKFFTNDDILTIYMSNERTGILSKKYAVTKSSIQRIKSGKTYSHITNPTEKYGLDK